VSQQGMTARDPTATEEDLRPSVALACNEVWGGNRKVKRVVQLPSLLAWVACAPFNEQEGGGDLHYMSVCDRDLIARVALADVSGHGSEVNAAAQTLRSLMRKNIDDLDQSQFMRDINNTFKEKGDHKYATAIALSFHRLTGQLSFSNAGHLPPLWYHAEERSWGWLEEGGDPTPRKSFGLPIGLIPGTDYSQTVVVLKPSDLLVLYTDGITEAENMRGESLDRQILLAWAKEAPVDSPTALGEALLERVETFRGPCRGDDETLLVLQRERGGLAKGVLEVAARYLLKFSRHLKWVTSSDEP
jgi:phosphoserine phosphatase RsbU/P